MCGATRTLCGRQSIYRSVGRVTLRLNCKQVPSRDHGWPGSAHPQPSDSSSSRERTPRQLRDQAPINPPPPPTSFGSRCRSKDAGGWRAVYCNTYFPDNQNNKTDPPSHPLPSFTSPDFQGDLRGGEKALGSNSLLFKGTFVWGRALVLFMGQHSVAIKALIKIVFWSQPWVTPPTPLACLVWFPLKEQQEEGERSGQVWECLYIVATVGSS